MGKSEPDVEKSVGTPELETTSAVPISEVNYEKGGVWGKLEYYNNRLERVMGIESRGIERVPESERPDKKLYGNLLVWLSANCVLPTFALGSLGPLVFEMGLGDSMATITFFVLIPAALPAFMSTFGPKLGLRQMTSARFSWGWYGAKFVATLNCIACVGWSVVNTIAGAQTLETVSDYSISAAVGTVIIAIITLFIGLFGYRFVHRFETFAWIPTLITFFVLLGVSAKHLVNLEMPTGQAEAASVLSFGAAIWGFVIGWSSLSSDYNVYMPAEAKSWKVFMWTYLGIATPCLFIMWLGAAVACAAVAYEPWGAAYGDHELGGLLGAVLIDGIGNGGKFFMVLLVLSVVANNIVNVYSMGMSVSVIARVLARVPRLVWPVVITAIYIPLAIAGADSFSTSLENFLNVLGYWLAIYVTVVLEEHFIFRKGDYQNYDAAAAWNNKDLVPWGAAALGAACFGIVGAAMGMAQVWYIGPIGALVGGSANPFGGDVGFELSASFTAVTYPVFRLLEKRYMRR